MRFDAAVLTLSLLTIFACKKDASVAGIPVDTGCIDRKTVTAKDHIIDPASVAVADNLFFQNGIDVSNYRYYHYVHQVGPTYFPPFAPLDSKSVHVDQFANGLRIFNGQLSFIFNNDTLSLRLGYLTAGTSLNSKPQLTTGQVRHLFINAVEQFDHAGSKYKDTCLNAEFGYYNLYGGTGTGQELLVKAWRVTIKNTVYPSEYPQGYFQDRDGKLIYYDNGIETFH